MMGEFPDELSGFEEAWNGNAKKHMPGLAGNFIGHNNMGKSNLAS